ncbi:MAG: copper chaperone PCu(A)C [Pseudomonadota bacterium]
MIRFALALALLPTAAFAGELTVEKPMVPLAPPGVMAHAAFFTLTNTGDTPRQLIGVSAEGYMMAHIHKTEVKDNVATMVSVDLLEIAPGQSIAFEHGGMHIMLMRPETMMKEGDMVPLTLEFANGETLAVDAMVTQMMMGGHAHDG